MNNKQRIWKKQEKQLVKLMYQKGIIDTLRVVNNVNDLYWQNYTIASGKYKSGKYKFLRYYDEVHYFTSDYWGEGDEHSLVGAYLDLLYWGNIKYDNVLGDVVPMKKIRLGRRQIIKRLKKLKTIKNDKKINKVVKKTLVNF